MDYIHDTTAFELSTAHGNPMSIPPAYADHYYAQLADTMAQLASLRFPLSASLLRTPLANYIIGLIAETNTGPYPPPHAFYHNYPLDPFPHISKRKRTYIGLFPDKRAFLTCTGMELKMVSR